MIIISKTMKLKRTANRKRKSELMLSHVQSRKRLKENDQAQKVKLNANAEVQVNGEGESVPMQAANVIPEVPADAELEAEAELEDKIVPEDAEVEDEEKSDVFLEDIYAPLEEPVEIQAGDIERAENFLDSLGNDLMESDFLELL